MFAQLLVDINLQKGKKEKDRLLNIQFNENKHNHN